MSDEIIERVVIACALLVCALMIGSVFMAALGEDTRPLCKGGEPTHLTPIWAGKVLVMVPSKACKDKQE